MNVNIKIIQSFLNLYIQLNIFYYPSGKAPLIFCNRSRVQRFRVQRSGLPWRDFHAF